MVKKAESSQKRVAVWSHWDWMVAGLGILLLILGTLFDMGINQAVNAPKSAFAVFLDRIGEMPGYLFLPFAAMVFFYAPPKPVAERAWARVIWKIVWFAATILTFYAVWEKIGGKWLPDDDYRSLFEMVFAVLSAVGFLWLLSAVPKETFQSLRRFALYAVVVFLFTTFLIEILKSVAGRMRYRDVIETANNSGFSPWYRWGLDNGKSFPSGHVGFAGGLFLLTALPNAFEKLHKYRVALLLGPLAFTLLVALARMMSGAHFLSDVSVSLLIAFLSARLISFLFWRKAKQTQKEDGKA